MSWLTLKCMVHYVRTGWAEVSASNYSNVIACKLYFKSRWKGELFCLFVFFLFYSLLQPFTEMADQKN